MEPVSDIAQARITSVDITKSGSLYVTLDVTLDADVSRLVVGDIVYLSSNDDVRDERTRVQLAALRKTDDGRLESLERQVGVLNNEMDRVLGALRNAGWNGF
jgi:hypothetical protein